MVELYIVSFFSFCTCGASLLGIWSVFGRSRAWLRGLILAVGCLAIGCLVCVGIGEMEGEWLVMIALICGGVGFSSAMMRCFGFHVVHQSNISSKSRQDSQFSLRQMMGMVTITACLLATIRILFDYVDSNLVKFSLVLALAFTVVAGAILWGVLMPQRTTASVAVIGVVVLVSAVAIYAVMEYAQIDPGLLWASIVVTHSVFLALALRKVRQRGYLLARVDTRSRSDGRW